MNKLYEILYKNYVYYGRVCISVNDVYESKMLAQHDYMIITDLKIRLYFYSNLL